MLYQKQRKSIKLLFVHNIFKQVTNEVSGAKYQTWRQGIFFLSLFLYNFYVFKGQLRAFIHVGINGQA